MDFSDRNLLTAPRVLTSSRGSAAGSTGVSANASTAASVASSGNSSSVNIEGLADAKSTPASSAADSPAAPGDSKPQASARDYKWLPRAPGTESSNASVTDSDAKSEGKSAAGDKSTGTSTPVQQQTQSVPSSSGGQVLGVAEVTSVEATKGLDYGDVPDEPAGE